MRRVEGAVAQPAARTHGPSWGGRAWLLAVGTGARIVVAPIVMGLVIGGDYTAAAILFALAAATDWFDGRLARRRAGRSGGRGSRLPLAGARDHRPRARAARPARRGRRARPPPGALAAWQVEGHRAVRGDRACDAAP